MASEIVEPEIERIKISLAEENLIEQIRNYLVKLTIAIQEIENMVNDLFNQKFEIARVRGNKIFEDFKVIYSTRSALTRYVAKVSMSIANGSYYMSLTDTISSLTNSLHKLVLDLELLTATQTNLGEGMLLSLQNILIRFREYVQNLCDIFKHLVESPSKVPSYATVLQKDFNEMLQMLREIYVNKGPGVYTHHIALLIHTLSTITYGLHDLGEKALWLYTLRVP